MGAGLAERHAVLSRPGELAAAEQREARRRGKHQEGPPGARTSQRDPARALRRGNGVRRGHPPAMAVHTACRCAVHRRFRRCGEPVACKEGEIIMAPYHHLMVHFPIALWTTATLVILWRAFSDKPLALAAGRVLTPLLVLGVVTGFIAYAIGLAIFPFAAIRSSH